MKTTKMKTNLPERRSHTALALGFGVFAGLAALPLLAAEYDEDNMPAGYNEDEWYDPGDWFDGNNIEVDGNDRGWWDKRGWDSTSSYDANRNNSQSSYSSSGDNNQSSTAASPYYYHYYWDPVVIGWTADDQNKSQSGKQQSNANSGSQSSMQQASFDGKVDGFKKVKLKDREGKTSEETFVRVTLKNGDHRVISLGSRVDLADLDLSKGDSISVAGTKARIDNSDVLVASRIDVGEQTFRIRKSNRPDTNQMVGRKSGKQSSTQQVSFDGKIDGFKKVNLKDRDGMTSEQTFVRVSLKNGDSRVISLGSQVDLADLDLTKGDTISVTGSNARIDNRDVLVASSINAGGQKQTFRIREGNRPETGQQVAIQGTVEDFTRTSLGDDKREKNLIVRLEMENGKSCTVDLGRGTTMQALDLEKGSEIRLQGEKTQVNGKQLIVAQKIRVDGESTELRGNSTDSDPTTGWNDSNRYDSADTASQDMEE